VQEAMPILVMLGVVILALILLLVGIFTLGRSGKARRAAAPQDALPPAEASEAATASLAPAEAVCVFFEPDGAASVEIEGRRFAQVSEVGDERLTQRALAALGALQRFCGIAPPRQALALNDELRAGHTPADGELVVEFQGQRFRRLEEVRDEETKRRLSAMLGELAAFSQGRAVSAPRAKRAEPEPLSEDKFLGQLVVPPSEPAPIKLPGLMDALRSPAPKPGPMPVGIAGQVEQVLQQQLVDSSTLRGRSIHVVTARDGSLNVQVEGQLLHWPDGVSEPDVREAVQKAIRTWEANAGF
jgi:hypothetical protein